MQNFVIQFMRTQQLHIAFEEEENEDRLSFELDDLYDSDYDMNETMLDDLDVDKFIDFDVEYAGVDTPCNHTVENESHQHIVDEGLNFSRSDIRKNSEGEAEGKKWPVFKPCVDMKNPNFRIGLTFASRDEFKEAIHNYAFNNGKDLKFEKNDKVRVTVSCKHPNCPWKINCRKLRNTSSCRVLDFVEKHEGCSWAFHNKMVTSSKVGKRWKTEIKSHSNWKIKEFRDKVSSDDKFHLSKRQAYRAMKKAKAEIRGEEEEDFSKLWSYCLEIHNTNPKTTCVVKLSDVDVTGEGNRFLRIYICWEACKEGYKYCRPIIGLDVCHLKCKLGGSY
ncbi:unnamed protein product [Cuscuta epithymum]|uniref:Transposase MuDR plant domain-containing protein n=1 Tax=Cuscuta epithymum TaxID=186058 RepID=A0AAV0DG29_9ASTE|nr:unnamed protein product [Cuscuta epithymum]